MEDVEASWSPCLPRQGRWDLLFVQICEPPWPSPAHKKCVMKPGSARCTVQLPTAGLELITEELLHGLSPCGGRPCLALATATLQNSPFLWFWPGIHLDFIRPHPHPSHLPTDPLSVSCTRSQCNTQSSHRSVAEALEQRSAGLHPRSSTAFLGETGGLLLGLCQTSSWQQHHFHQLAGSLQIKISGAKHVSFH